MVVHAETGELYHGETLYRVSPHIDLVVAGAVEEALGSVESAGINREEVSIESPYYRAYLQRQRMLQVLGDDE
ncbi:MULTISPECIES: hypothetical protein [Bacillus]|uniref:hypothetical protein n=1 Tax=Bacillus TaxID=1386 RepID=UPI001E2C6B56|nr:hypothetical protein [Bacillus rhizoplanae]